MVVTNRNRSSYIDSNSTDIDNPLSTVQLAQDLEDDSKASGICTRPRKETCLRSLFAVVYTITQVILILLFFMTMYYPYAVLTDIRNNRDKQHLYTVELPGHRPQALFLQCIGMANETILIETGLTTTAYMILDGLPRQLSQHYGYKVNSYSMAAFSIYIPNTVKPLFTSSIQFFTSCISS